MSDTRLRIVIGRDDPTTPLPSAWRTDPGPMRDLCRHAADPRGLAARQAENDYEYEAGRRQAQARADLAAYGRRRKRRARWTFRTWFCVVALVACMVAGGVMVWMEWAG